MVERDQSGVDARYLAADGLPPYERAFVRLLSAGLRALEQMQPEEAAALREVFQATSDPSNEHRRARVGGFGFPFALDPTINLSSAGRSIRSAKSRP